MINLRKNSNVLIVFSVLPTLSLMHPPGMGTHGLILQGQAEYGKGQVTCTRDQPLKRTSDWTQAFSLLSTRETTFQLENKANKNQINKNPLFYLWIQMTVAFCPKILSNLKWLFFPSTLEMNHKLLQQNRSLLPAKVFHQLLASRYILICLSSMTDGWVLNK